MVGDPPGPLPRPRHHVQVVEVGARRRGGGTVVAEGHEGDVARYESLRKLDAAFAAQTDAHKASRSGR